jgi:lipoprotein-releasing system permease protein
MRDMEDLPEGEKAKGFDSLTEMDLSMELTVVGIFSPPHLQDMSDIDLAIVPLHIGRELFSLDGGITSLGIEVSDPYKAGEVNILLSGIRDKETGSLTPDSPTPVLPVTWSAFTWIEKHQTLFDTVQSELQLMYFILFFIVIVAAFCVMNTMITVTVQKRREIGILSALGTRIGQVVWVFLTQGMIVGALGSLSGVGMGLLVVYFRNAIRGFLSKYFGWEIFASEIYGLIEIPAKVIPHDVTIICSGAFILCTIAALVPAFIAARTEPAVALRD